jgi:hypothetical protein
MYILLELRMHLSDSNTTNSQSLYVSIIFSQVLLLKFVDVLEVEFVKLTHDK